jgi:alpha-galactosidase
VLERTDRVWVSDCIDPLERLTMHRWTTQLIPPELMGAHIASGRSHTTGRVHDLDFRAATAIFGHLGIEWDLARAAPEELEQLRAWIELFKRHRELLLDGDLVRVNLPDSSLSVHGVVAADRSRSIFAFTAVGRSEVVSPGRLRFAGLDPHRRYRVTPMMIDYPPIGLKPPVWWGVEPGPGDGYAELAAGGHAGYRVPEGGQLGIELPGGVLMEVGLAAAAVHPEHTVLYHLVAVD